MLRQTLLSSLGTSAAAQTPAAPAASTLAPSLAPDAELQEILLPMRACWPAPLAIRAAARAGGDRRGIEFAAAGAAGDRTYRQSCAGGDGVAEGRAPGRRRFSDQQTASAFRGALPSPQPVALASIASDAPLATTAHQLLDDTEGAIARQTLLQVASLPDRIDMTAPRLDPTTPRWHFEIPFVTPQGTAMAQFEIARDGGGSETEGAKRMWRARFSIDVEPAGPVHALVSLIDDKTSVRMWAERPATVAQLRADAAQLSQALSKAELVPGDIVIRDGAPPQRTPAPAGHFVDRAL